MFITLDVMLNIYNIKFEQINIGDKIMSFREKILWATLFGGLAPYVWYFGSVALAMTSGSGAAALSIGGLVGAIIVGLIIMIIVVATVAIANRNEGEMRPDEREHRIESRGIVISYHMLCTGVILTIGAAWLGWSAISLIHLLALIFIMSEMTRVIVEIHGLRRGY